MTHRNIKAIVLTIISFALLGASSPSRPILGKAEWPDPNRGLPESILAFHPPTLFYENEYTGIMCFSEDGWRFVSNLFYFKVGPTIKWGISVSVTDPKGVYHIGAGEIDGKGVVYSRDSIDIKFKDSYISGKNPNYRIHFVTDNIIVDLTYKSRSKVWAQGDDGKFNFGPGNKYFLDLGLAAPWADVTGSFIIKGQKYNFNGQGYIDHGHYSVPFNRALPIWEGFIAFTWKPVDGHMWSFTVFDYVTHPEFGGGRIATFIALKDNKIVYASPLYTIEAQDFRKDPKTGIEFPWRIVAHSTGGACSFQGVSTAKQQWEVLDIFGELPEYVRKVAMTFLKRPVYWRAFGTFDGTFTCQGETVQFKQIASFHDANYTR